MTDETCHIERLDEVVLALLWANGFEEKFGGHRAWKSLPWDALDRLHAKGWISAPSKKTYSVTFDDTAWTHGREQFQHWFGKPAQTAAAGKTVTRAKVADKPIATVHQFKIVLDYSAPPIWRRIQLPSAATFWDLHCAINDAMGWEDEHLHEFHVGSKRHDVRIGIPMQSDMPWGEDNSRADWEVPIAEYFDEPNARANYVYDFGDGWSHEITLEAIAPREVKVKYPRCLDGARACPPEDCGGLPGYMNICAALANPADVDEDTEDLLECFDGYDPEAFDPAEVKFYSAAGRLKNLRGAR